ncbi:hypothetical protein Nepgr_028150 [Nepenthes gracilis]|uniref:Uncharacterized protein n=1 Tax=Nepenthes gracilis TaxID=150966 RepID=A0AAD3Y1V0_NEPGR|nr:hypothetical protein Nepgr_028150 [Nepenthes gracilis]
MLPSWYQRTHLHPLKVSYDSGEVEAHSTSAISGSGGSGGGYKDYIKLAQRSDAKGESCAQFNFQINNLAKQAADL